MHDWVRLERGSYRKAWLPTEGADDGPVVMSDITTMATRTSARQVGTTMQSQHGRIHSALHASCSTASQHTPLDTNAPALATAS